MTTRIKHPAGPIARIAKAGASFAIAGLVLTVAGCRPGEEPGAHVAGWTLIDPAQRHPIVVSQEPASMSVRVSRGARGLSPQQRSNVVDFLNRYRGRDTGNGKISIAVPSGASNDVASLHAVADLRDLLREYAIDESSISVKAYHADGGEPPIRMSYARFVAEAPNCGQWPNNVGDDKRNLPYHDFGCSTQRNLAAQIANPADLLGPRTMTAAPSERRDQAWEKWVKGESTIAEKKADERSQIKGAQ
jgi:pilus assembly protein CpaD